MPMPSEEVSQIKSDRGGARRSLDVTSLDIHGFFAIGVLCNDFREWVGFVLDVVVLCMIFGVLHIFVGVVLLHMM